MKVSGIQISSGVFSCGTVALKCPCSLISFEKAAFVPHLDTCSLYNSGVVWDSILPSETNWVVVQSSLEPPSGRQAKEVMSRRMNIGSTRRSVGFRVPTKLGGCVQVWHRSSCA